MPRRLLAVSCLSLALLGLAGASFRLRLSPFPPGDEATHMLMARSLWEEGDLVFDAGDLAAGYAIWHGGPAGVTLLTPDGGRSLRFAEPFAWALIAAPAFALLGPAGLPVLEMALFLAMLAAALRLFQKNLRDDETSAGLSLGGFFFASAALGYVFRGSPEVFLMACTFFALVLWRLVDKPWALAVAGALLAVACLHEPLLALLGLAVAADLVVAKWWRGAAVLVLSGALVFGALAVEQRRLTGVWNPSCPAEGVQRRSFDGDFPLDTPPEASQDLWQGYGKTTSVFAEVPEGLRLLPRNLVYFLAGRHAGLLAAFPFGLLMLLLTTAGPRDRSRLLLLGAIVSIVLAGLILDPHRWHGGPGALGNARFAVLYPALLFLPDRLPVRRRLVLLPYAAVALWTAASVAAAVFPGALPAASASLPAFRMLPVELTLLGGGVQLPGYHIRTMDGRAWVFPVATSWPEEDHPNGVWLRGAAVTEVIVVSPRPLATIQLSLHALADNDILLESSAESVRVRFDSDDKRHGTPVELKAGRAAVEPGILPGAGEEWVYRFTAAVSDGVIPARLAEIAAGSRDTRYLGVFLDLNGKGL